MTARPRHKEGWVGKELGKGREHLKWGLGVCRKVTAEEDSHMACRKDGTMGGDSRDSIGSGLLVVKGKICRLFQVYAGAGVEARIAVSKVG